MALATLPATARPLVWQPGQITSMKEEVTDRDQDWTSYIYTLQTRDRSYSVVLPAPLKALMRTTVKFAVDKDVVYIQDAGGKVRKACILEPRRPDH